MGQILLKNARLLLDGGVVDGAVLIRDGRLAAAFGADNTPRGLDSGSLIDLDGRYLAPGLVDIHIHGSAGIDVLCADDEQWAALSRFLLSQGVTGYFPTFVPVGEEQYDTAIESIQSYIAGLSRRNEKKAIGARILGVHFEGPFVSKRRCGALHPAYFRAYDGNIHSLETFCRLLAERQPGESANPSTDGIGLAVLMTIAPEIDGGIALIRDLTARGVRAFIGHSVANLEILDRAFDAGARHITHFPNALEPLHHRNPGAVGWGLVNDEISVDCIADFNHVHALMLKLIYQNKGPGKLALISDAIPPTGLGDGEYEVWGDRIAVRDGRTSVAGEAASDTIAGSVITLLDAVKNVVGLGIPVHEALCMASVSAARAAGVDSDFGSIEVGKRADLVALDDNLTIRLSMVDGEIGFDAR